MHWGIDTTTRHEIDQPSLAGPKAVCKGSKIGGLDWKTLTPE
jgi:hypothetical protein